MINLKEVTGLSYRNLIILSRAFSHARVCILARFVRRTKKKERLLVPFPSRAFSHARVCILARFVRRTKKKERLLVVYR